jgi:hypothetical protein
MTQTQAGMAPAQMGGLMVEKRLGQPPKGPDGQRVSEYPRVALRLPPRTLAAVQALAVEQQRPLWLLIDEAIREKLERLPPDLHGKVLRARPRRRPLRQFKTRQPQ